jgi:ribonucleoside-diphosphate reductase alpha chain
MHLDKFPKLADDIVKAYEQVYDLKVMPSMRSLQFGGSAIQKNNTRQYNCSFLHMNRVRAFAETLYLLLCGTGVGFSVQKHHINQLPRIRHPKRENIHIINDSIEGWADALDALMTAYFYGAIRPIFDYSQISAKGTLLVTTGSKAPGPEPLKIMLETVEAKLRTVIDRKLTTLEVHDLECIAAECVLSGGIRRAALISLFDKDDEDLLTCKQGEWWVKTPYRARANNSAVLLRSDTTKEEFRRVYEACIKSNAGEPGFIWTNNLEMGKNPCCEISVLDQEFCNLTTTSISSLISETDLMNRVQASSFIGTLQASYTDFPYLAEKWKQNSEEEALLGCSFTGIAESHMLSAETLQTAANVVLDTNYKYAKILGINPAARATTIKPEGSASCVLGSSSGIHARHSNFYLRRVRFNKEEPLAKYLKLVIPELIEDDLFSQRDSVVTIPQESPPNSIVREQESALQLLNRVLFYNENWIKPGHRSGSDRHNVSCTINYKSSEIEELFEQMWVNRNIYSGISLLPMDDSIYQQAPFEACSKELFEKYENLVKDIDLTKVLEIEDSTDLTGQLACSGISCEIK